MKSVYFAVFHRIIHLVRISGATRNGKNHFMETARFQMVVHIRMILRVKERTVAKDLVIIVVRALQCLRR